MVLFCASRNNVTCNYSLMRLKYTMTCASPFAFLIALLPILNHSPQCQG